MCNVIPKEGEAVQNTAQRGRSRQCPYFPVIQNFGINLPLIFIGLIAQILFCHKNDFFLVDTDTPMIQQTKIINNCKFQLKKIPDLRLKSHVQHSVSFIQDYKGDGIKTNSSSADQVIKSSWCCNNNFHTLCYDLEKEPLCK